MFTNLSKEVNFAQDLVDWWQIKTVLYKDFYRMSVKRDQS